MNNKITYRKVGDYYLPNLVLVSEDTNYKIGKYGRIKLTRRKIQRQKGNCYDKNAFGMRKGV